MCIIDECLHRLSDRIAADQCPWKALKYCGVCGGIGLEKSFLGSCTLFDL